MAMKQVPNETAASLSREYRSLARSYERRWQRYLSISSARSLALLEPRNGECILDAGCDTGLLLRRIAACAPDAHLVGLDLTPAMLCQANPTITDRVLGDVCCLPFANASLNAVVIASVLQYLPDVDVAVAEIARVLRPEGRVVMILWDGDSLRTRLLRHGLNLHGAAAIHLHRRADVIAACRNHGVSIHQEQHYSAGALWRLASLLGMKHAEASIC